MSTPYRNDSDALQQRKASLECELAEVRSHAQKLDVLRTRDVELTRELASVERQLGENSSKRALPMLDRIKIAAPCTASWDDMVGNGQVRFCGQCQKNVFNLSGMSREDAEGLLQQHTQGEGQLCVRLYRRADGTVITDDCPVGSKKRRRRRLALAAAGVAVAAYSATQLASRTCTSHTMGAVVEMGDVPSSPANGH